MIGANKVAASNSVRVLAFAGVRDAVGMAEFELPLSAQTTAAALLSSIVSQFPVLGPFQSMVRLAINGSYACAEDPVLPGDEVALIPPVAGG